VAEVIAELRNVEVAVWPDDLADRGSSLEAGWRSGVIAGIATDPTIFAVAIAAGSVHEDQVRDLTCVEPQCAKLCGC
jgi:hypothetical protein